MENILNDLSTQVGDFLPGILGALAVLIIGWFLAGVIRRLVHGGLKKTDLDNKIFKGASSNISPERFIAKLVYYLVLMVVLLVVLEMLGVHNVLDPVKKNGFFFSSRPGWHFQKNHIRYCIYSNVNHGSGYFTTQCYL